MVELFPYAERSRGISVEQAFVRGAGFFTTFVNPIGMDGAGWKYLIMYIVMICVEIVTIYFFYPETQGRTLEELAFCKHFPVTKVRVEGVANEMQCLRMRASLRRLLLLWRRRFIMRVLMMRL
jgi:Na+/melibiose symporter-like transporter